MLLKEEQKRFRQKCKEISDLLFIDKMILREVWTRTKNLAVALIACKEAYDMVLHSWIVECLDMVVLSEKNQAYKNMEGGFDM